MPVTTPGVSWPLVDLGSRGAELAVELVAAGARITVVGSTARRLVGRCAVPPRDLDVVVAPGDVDRLADALAAVGVPAAAARLRRASVTSWATAWGPLDVFVRPGGARGQRVVVDVAGREVAVAGG